MEKPFDFCFFVRKLLFFQRFETRLDACRSGVVAFLPVVPAVAQNALSSLKKSGRQRAVTGNRRS